MLIAWRADRNFGGRSDMDVGLNGSAPAHTLLRFPLTSLAGEIGQVRTARIRLFLKNTYGDNAAALTQIGVFQLRNYNAKWQEGTGNSSTESGLATFSARSRGGDPWPGEPGANGAGRDFFPNQLAAKSVPTSTAVGQSVDFDLTGDLSFLEDWANGARNGGFLLKDVSGNEAARRVNFYSSEASDPALRPQLILTYDQWVGDTVTLTNPEDAQVIPWGGASGKNFGARPNLDVGTNPGSANLGPASSFFRFDLSTLKSEILEVDSATLELTIARDYNYNGAAEKSVLGLHRVYYPADDWKAGTGQGATGSEGISFSKKRPSEDASWVGAAGGGLAGVDYFGDTLAQLPMAEKSVAAGTKIQLHFGGDLGFLREWADGFVPNAGFRLTDISGDDTAGRINFHSAEALSAADRPKLVVRYRKKPSTPPRELFMATDGRDSNAGTIEAPLRTITGARNRIRTLRRSGYPAGGFHVNIRGGIYPSDTLVSLRSEDSGEPGAPIIYRAYQEEKVVFEGAQPLPVNSFAPLSPTDPRRNRLPQSVRNAVRVMTVTDSSLQRLLRNPFAELNFNGAMIQPARWPDRGMNHVGSVVANGTDDRGGNASNPNGARFRTREGHSHPWAPELARLQKAQVIGYFGPDWRRDQTSIANVQAATNPDAEVVQLVRYRVDTSKSTPRKFFVFNLLAELTAPGEWYFDNTDNSLYLYPPDPLTADTTVSVWGGNSLIAARDLRHFRLQNVIVQNIAEGGPAIADFSDCLDCALEGVTIRRSRRSAANFTGETRLSGMRSCDLIDLPQFGRIYGPNVTADSLVQNRNFAINNHCALVGSQNMFPNMACNGGGNLIRNNLFHNCPVQVFNYNSNDTLYAHNELFNVGFWEADGGAFYAAARMWSYGNVFRQNFIHHIIGMKNTISRAGIMPDDHDGGEVALENFFYKCGQRGFFANQGHGHLCDGNIVLEGGRHGMATQGGTGSTNNYNAWRNGTVSPLTKADVIGRTEALIGEKGWQRDPWAERYPQFRRIMDQNELRFYPLEVTFRDTVHRAMPDPVNFTNLRRPVVTETGTTSLPSYDLFADIDSLDLRLGANRPNNTRALPFEKVGLFIDEFRKTKPDPASYRYLVRERFKNTRGWDSGTYNANENTARVYYNSGRLTYPEVDHEPTVEGQVVVSPASEARWLRPTSAVPTAWNTLAFNDSSWNQGKAALGYQTSLDGRLVPYIGTDLRSAGGPTRSAFLRIPFQISAGIAEKPILRLRYDDAIVAYLNGTEVFRSAGVPAGQPTWATTATSARPASQVLPYQTIDLTGRENLLQTGENLLAIQVLNASATDDTLLINPLLSLSLGSETPQSQFQQWATQQGLSGASAALTADPDRDGANNLLEYALGTLPLQGNSLPQMTLQTENNLAFSIDQRSGSGRGLSYRLMTSTDLQGPWLSTSSATAIVSASPLTGFNRVTYRTGSTTGTRRFFRLEITFTP